MAVHVALLRAVNVGGTGKLPMSELKQICEDAGFARVKTYIASGNVVFASDLPAAEVKSALESRLEEFTGKKVGVIIRSREDLESVLKHDPFPDHPGNKVMVLFTDAPLPHDPAEGATGRRNEELRLGAREMYILYPDGMGQTRLRIAAAQHGTSRNMNTVRKLAAMAAELG